MSYYLYCPDSGEQPSIVHKFLGNRIARHCEIILGQLHERRMAKLARVVEGNQLKHLKEVRYRGFIKPDHFENSFCNAIMFRDTSSQIAVVNCALNLWLLKICPIVYACDWLRFEFFLPPLSTKGGDTVLI